MPTCTVLNFENDECVKHSPQLSRSMTGFSEFKRTNEQLISSWEFKSILLQTTIAALGCMGRETIEFDMIAEDEQKEIPVEMHQA